MPDDRYPSNLRVVHDEPEPVRVGVQARRRRKRLGASMAGKLGHEELPARKEQRREREPVRRRAAEPVNQ